VLDAQRSLFTAELDEANATTEHSKSLVHLYKALGGGWPTSAAAADAAAAQKPAPKNPG
jgi:outer membrane protein TolC